MCVVFMSFLLLLMHSASASASTRTPRVPCVQNSTYPTLLPSSVIPTYYNLHLTFPDPNDAVKDLSSPLQFSGLISINVTVNTPTSCIVVHAGNFNYSSITLDGVAIAATSVSGDLLTLHLSAKSALLTPGDRRLLVFKYIGYVRDDTDPGVDGAHGVFLSPNTVPPPTPPDSSSSSSSSSSSLSSSLASWSTHRSQRPRQLRRRYARKWRDSLRASRRSGDPMMIATQFEESDARNMFPSWDEPTYKALFAATIVAPNGLQVFFNTPELKQVSTPTMTTVSFKVTKHPLPSYLVALAIGHFDTLEKVSRGVHYRIITPVGYASWATLALNSSIHAAEWFGDKYGLPYSDMNDKMDSISVGGIDMDAMENQGLLTYAPQMLLLNPDPTQLPPAPCGEWGRFGQAQLIMAVTTHEVHHMHFGDTVTMRDWSQEYLNEGFTRFAQSYGVDHLAPSFDMTCLTGRSQGARNNFYQFSYEVAMTFDTPGTAPSIVYPIRGGGDIPPFPHSSAAALDAKVSRELDSELDPTKAPLFSRMFYEKGASVNRMVATVLGWEEWYFGLSRQLKRHMWLNPTVGDMMRSLDQSFVSVGLPTAVNAMLPWLTRPGYPVVTLSVVNGTTLVARQVPMCKYLANQAPWWIPLQVHTNSSRSASLLSFNTTTTTREYATPLTDVVGDPFFWGFFIVRYDTDTLWNARVLTAAATHAVTPDYTRELLFHLTLLVQMSHERAQRLSDALSTLTPVLASNPRMGGWEGESALYEMIMEKTTPIVATLGSCGAPCSDAYDTLTTVLRTMLGDLTRRLGWVNNPNLLVERGAVSTGVKHILEETKHTMDASVPWPTKEDAGMSSRDESMLRPLAALNAVIYNDTGAVQEAIVIFRNSTKATGAPVQSVQGPFARAAYFAAAKYGTKSDRNALVALLSASGHGDDTADILFGLTASASTEVDCPVALELISTGYAFSLEVKMSALVDMLMYATACHQLLVPAVVALADEMWKEEGQDATLVVKQALNHFCTIKELVQARALFQRNSKYISVTDAHAVTTNIRINVDAVQNNINIKP